ncbi:hypothetical protein EPO33_01705 [Patescibacteria group bacterium]|nr:MAG: hypothetical protein EPO33_01705 [Patescibacteria group bacterium]
MFHPMAWSSGRRGQSSVEVMIALALFVLLTMAAFTLFGTALSQDALSRQRQAAQNLAQEGQEAARQIRNTDWDALAVGTHGLVLNGNVWSFSGSEDVQDGIYHRSVVVIAVGDDAREVVVTVQWTSAGGGNAVASATSRLTHWQGLPLPLASNCRSTFSATGDWSNPVVLGSADIGSGNQGTDIAVKLPYAFVSGVAASASKPDLFVFDVSNPAAPTLVTSVDIGSGGINSLSLSGNTLYAASPNDGKELIVFDVTTPTSTASIGSVNMSGSANALSVLASDGWVAVGRAEGSSSEIVIYSVSNPASPVVEASYGISGDINDFAVSATNLYAVSESASQDITTIDMTDPANPSLVGSFDLHDGLADISIAFQDPNTIFTGNVDGKIIVLDSTNPTDMTIVDEYNTQGNVNDILCVVNNLIFAGTTNSNKEFQILNISDLLNITEYASLNFPQMATGVDFADNNIYVSVRSNDALRILTSTP